MSADRALEVESPKSIMVFAEMAKVGLQMELCEGFSLEPRPCKTSTVPCSMYLKWRL